MKGSLHTVALAAAAAWAIGIPAGASAAPLDELNRFAGTWQSQGSFVDTPYSKAGDASATTTCEWSIDRSFMICQQRVIMNGKPDDDIAIYTYDQAAQAYHFYNVRPTQSTSITITIAGDTITYPFSFTDQGKTVMVRTLNLWKNPSLYTWRTEYSLDGGATWKLMASGTSRK